MNWSRTRSGARAARRVHAVIALVQAFVIGMVVSNGDTIQRAVLIPCMVIGVCLNFMRATHEES